MYIHIYVWQIHYYHIYIHGIYVCIIRNLYAYISSYCNPELRGVLPLQESRSEASLERRWIRSCESMMKKGSQDMMIVHDIWIYLICVHCILINIYIYTLVLILICICCLFYAYRFICIPKHQIHEWMQHWVIQVVYFMLSQVISFFWFLHSIRSWMIKGNNGDTRGPPGSTAHFPLCCRPKWFLQNETQTVETVEAIWWSALRKM